MLALDVLSSVNPRTAAADPLQFRGQSTDTHGRAAAPDRAVKYVTDETFALTRASTNYQSVNYFWLIYLFLYIQ